MKLAKTGDRMWTTGTAWVSGCRLGTQAQNKHDKLISGARHDEEAKLR